MRPGTERRALRFRIGLSGASGCLEKRPLEMPESSRLRSTDKRQIRLARGTRTRGTFTRNHMLWTIVVILLVLWGIGIATHVLGAFIHILLVLALIMLAVRLVRGT